MIVERIRVRNYKSIVDSGYVNVRKFAVLAGRNNAGKTAFIEAIYRCLQGAFQSPGHTTVAENSEAISQSIMEPVSLDIVARLNTNERTRYLADFGPQLQSDRITVSLLAGDKKTYFVGLGRMLADGTEDELFAWHNIHAATQYRSKLSTADGVVSTTDISLKFASEIFYDLSALFMFVNGDRIVQPNQAISSDYRLNTSASNLHTVLHTLHNNKEEIFDLINEMFRLIFPEVKRLHTPVLDGSLTSIQLELAHSSNPLVPIWLHECGSGFTQALIILCVLCSDTKRLVLFDEPHAFLHPSAEKAIYDLAAKHASHQFVFTTHSPVLINYPVDRSLYLITKESGKSKFNALDSVTEALSDIGIRNSDYALSDRVLFVEGPTEELIIPLILGHYGMERIGYNYTIISLFGVGKEYSKRAPMEINAKVLDQVFRRTADSPIPYLLLIDRDEKQEPQIGALMEKYKGNIRVLPRREIENYLVVPEAIAAIISRETGQGVSAGDIASNISKCLADTGNKQMFPKGCTDPVVDVKASSVLEQVFAHNLCEYRKVRHGVMLVNWLLDNGYDDLKEVAEILQPFIAS